MVRSGFGKECWSFSMEVFFADDFESLKDFASQPDQLAIFKREKPAEAGAFFAKLGSTSFGIFGEVARRDPLTDIEFLLEEDIPLDIQSDPFYKTWLEDMAQVCLLFCDVEQSEKVHMWLGSKRGCRRYHIDNVPRRLLVTYDGKGTEWLPEHAANRDAFSQGEPNEKIVRDYSARQFMSEWDISIFLGGPSGLLHRTPDDALKGHSILMRLDNETFGRNVNRLRSNTSHKVQA